jgi:undecaprenyl diphosphate synthase
MLRGIDSLLKKGISVTAKSLKASLMTGALPPVDLIIRTSGEYRLSTGFMMWDLQYAELYFSQKLWPDFTKTDLKRALTDYSNRDRRFGK